MTEAGSTPLMALDAEDQEFVIRFVLASGSLKDVAAAYGVSYPTIRARLDRLIARLKALSDGRPLDPMAELLSGLIERGEITGAAAKRVLKLHRDRLPTSGEPKP